MSFHLVYVKLIVQFPEGKLKATQFAGVGGGILQSIILPKHPISVFGRNWVADWQVSNIIFKY